MNADDRDIKLVLLVKHHDNLYDRNSKDFRDKGAVENAWKTVSKSMGTTVDDCQRRWYVLRNRYAKERREQTTNDPSKKPWPLMHTLSFLEAHVKRRRSFRSLAEMQEYVPERPAKAQLNERLMMAKTEVWDEIIIDEDEEVEDVKSEPPSENSNPPSFFKEISIHPLPLPETQPVPKIISTTSLRNPNDLEIINCPIEDLKVDNNSTNGVVCNNHENDAAVPHDSNMHFCLSLNESLKKIAPKYLTKTKIEILQVIEKYENVI